MAKETDILEFLIAGLTYHIPDEEKECGRFEGMLVPDPTNVHDANAIKVCKKDGTLVGYVPRKKTFYIKKVTDGKDFPCSIEIYKLMDRGEFIGTEGKCTIRDERVGEIDQEKFKDPDIDGREDEPVVLVRSEALDVRNREREFCVYIGEWRDAATAAGYANAMSLARKVEKAIRYASRFAGRDDQKNPWTSDREIRLTVRQKTPWWHCGRKILKKQTVRMPEYMAYWIETKVLNVHPRRYRNVKNANETSSNYSAPTTNGGFSLWSIFSFFDGLFSSTPSLPSVSASPSSFMDWELFEAQIESDSYFDFGW